MRDDFSGVEKELNTTANMICGKIEEHDNQITTELMRMNQILKREMIFNHIGRECGGTWGWRPWLKVNHRWRLFAMARLSLYLLQPSVLPICFAIMIMILGSQWQREMKRRAEQSEVRE